MIYELTTTREGVGYLHALCIMNGSSFDRLVVWNRKKHKGVIADMIDTYAKTHEVQLAKLGRLEKATSRLETK